MSLSIYTHDNDTAIIDKTDKFTSCSFEIGLSTMSFQGAVKQLPEIQGRRIMSIHGVADDAIEVGYSTAWGESPGAKAVATLKEFTRTDAFKMFSGNYFNSNAATDKWTQIIPKDGTNISVAIKFRAYYKANYLNANSYMTIIPWLTFLTSPMTEFSLTTEIDNIVGALSNAKAQGQELGRQLNSVAQSNGTFTEEAVNTLHTIFHNIEAMSTTSRGTAVFTLQYGDMIRKNDKVDWIIKDLSFTPSVQCGPNDQPLWVDFNINMETNQKLSYENLSKIFNFIN